jgi:hypothetical protein
MNQDQVMGSILGLAAVVAAQPAIKHVHALAS